MKFIFFVCIFLILLALSLHAADSTENIAPADDIVIEVRDGLEEYDFFVDKDGDGICDDRTLRNKGIFSQHKKIHHYRMISYKYDHQFRSEFGSSKDGKRGQGGNGHNAGGGHNGGK